MNNKRENINITDGAKVFALAIFIPAFVSVLLAFVMYGNNSFLADTAARYWVLAFLGQFLLLACAVGYSAYGKINLIKAVGFKTRPRLYQAGLIVVLALALLCFNLPVQYAVTSFFAKLGLDMSGASTMPAISDGGTLTLAVLLVAVMPAFAEEIIYRGFICGTLSAGDKKIGPGAVFVSAAIFSIMHQSPLQTVHPFILGCVMAVVYLSTRSLWASVLLHFTNNFAVILLGCFAPGFEAFVVSNWWWVMPVAALVIAPIIFLFVKTASQKSDEELRPITVAERNKSLPFFAAAVFFCLFMWFFVLFS